MCCVIVWLSAGPSDADIFALRTGGEIRGEWVNRDQPQPQVYVIRPFAGGEITLAASAVARVVAQDPNEIAYERFRLQHDDTVEGNWKIAEWCQQNRLYVQRKKHLERILQLDGDHQQARRVLGFQRVGDRWLTQDQIMAERGMVKHRGRWITPQKLRLMEQQEKQQLAEQEWYKRVRRWSGWLDSSSKAVRAKEYLLAIRSAAATPALIKSFESAKGYEHKEVLAEALSNVGTGKAVEVLVRHSIENDDEDFRYFCLELLERSKSPSAVDFYIQLLKKSDDNRHINRAAIGIERMGDMSAVGPLIDALVTQHKFKLGRGSPGQTTTTFGRGTGSNKGTSFGTGTPKVVKRWLQNQEVHAALASLTGKDFAYDVKAWREWYKHQRPAPPRINTRRDDG
jgi:hypothetical protein